MVKISKKLSEQALTITTVADVRAWLHAAEKEVGGLLWVALGGIANNVHTVQVSAESALALVERPLNSIDAVPDLPALERGRTGPAPH